MQADGLDQLVDLGLRATDEQVQALHPKAAGEDGEVEHQRRVGEHEFGEIDDDVALRAQRTRQRLAPTARGVAIFVTTATQRGGRVIEGDDRGNLLKAQANSRPRAAQIHLTGAGF